ncbi:diguanylate cyclase domain-containing protein [Pseudoalteromonas pernae]|uniref:diguanylate cyclase domain-containing protein n=1 Tax=Pseudoalteromonas pernae TaxID=3118054 RepID=UPI00324209E2
MVRLLVTLFCVLFMHSIAWAKVQRLSVSEGLSHNTISNFVIDKQGFLWVATERGLNKYDGYTITPVSNDKVRLDEAMIDTLYIDKSGDIWVSSILNGLFRYRVEAGLLEQVLVPEDESDSSFATAIFSMLSVAPNKMLLGRGEDVALLNPLNGRVTSLFKVSNEQNRALVRSLFRHQDYVFVGTSRGAYVYDLKSESVRHLQHLPDEVSGIHQDNVKSFALADDNTLLVGTVKGLYQVDIGDIEQFFATPNKAFSSRTLLADLNIWQMTHRDPSSLLLATDKGLFVYDINTHALVRHRQLDDSPFSLSDASVTSVAQTPQGDLWVGTKRDGAFFLPNKQFAFRNLSPQTLKGEGLSHANVWSTAQNANTVFLGTHNGLTLVDVATMTSEVKFKNFLSDELDNVFSIFTLILHHQQLIMNTTRGLFIYDLQSQQLNKLVTRNPEHQGFLEGWLHGLYVSDDGALYGVNQNHGYFLYDIQSTKLTPLEGDLKAYAPFSALGFSAPLPDQPSSPLFFANGRLMRFDPSQQSLELLFEVSKINENLAINLNGYALDNNNILWMSFSNYGLVALNTHTFEVIKHLDLQRRGLSNLMYDLVRDQQGQIWMSSHTGLWRFNPETEHFMHYTQGEGLATDEFNPGSVSYLPDGRLLFGSVQGATLFYPEQNKPTHPLLQQVNFTAAELMYRDLQRPVLGPLKQVYLAHDDVGLEISFSAMAFNYQDRIIYEYQLDGSQKSFTRDNNRVVFSKLNPGEHLLKVWAQDPLTGELTTPARLAIHVAYPPWSSPGYITLYIIITVSLFAAWLYRRNYMQRMLMAAHKQSQESAARLKLALEGSHSGVWDWHCFDSKIYQPRLREELGYDYEHCQLDDYLALIHPDERQKFRIEWLEFLSTDKGYFNCVYRLRHRSGLWRWYKDFGKVMEWDGAHPTKVAGTYTNMTRELVFEENARLFGAAFEQTSDWVIILDHKLRITATNKALRQHFNYTPSCRSSRRLTLGLSKNTRINYLRILSGLRVGEHYQCEEVVVIKNGEHVPVLLKMSAVADNEQHATSFIVMMTDISEPKSALLSKRERAHYDSLTGFPNRALFMDRVEHALEQATRNRSGCALILINLTNLTAINDKKGFDSGDQLLLSLAYRLQRTVRAQDSLGRVHGDEFALLLEDIDDVEQVITVCTKVRDVLVQPFKQRMTEPSVRVSLGVSLFPQDARVSEELLKCADLAIYHAKRAGVNQCHFFQGEINAAVQRSIDTERDVRKACEQLDFINLYQGVYGMHGSHLSAFSVLLYWQQGDNLVPPEEFLPHIRQPELWAKLLMQTLERAVMECRVWHRQQPMLGLCLNISGREFSQPGSLGDIIHLLHSYDFPLPYLTLEITVKDWQRMESRCKKTLQDLVSEGVRVSLHIEEIADLCIPEFAEELFGQVKLGETIIKDICAQNTVNQKVRRYMAIFSAMGIDVIAVGVENATQQRKLLSLGCNLMQGEAVHAPCHGDNVAQLLVQA